MNITIQTATESDAGDLAFVICESWRSAYADIISPEELEKHTDSAKRTEQFRKWISSGLSNYLIARDDGKPCGICTYGASRDNGMEGFGEIVAIYTLSEYWNRGLGKRIMDAAVEDLRALGYDKIMCRTYEANTRARRFYEKYGFRADGTYEDSGMSGALTVRYILEVN